METPPRTPELSPIIPLTPPPVIRNADIVNTPDTVIDEPIVLLPRILFDEDDDDTVIDGDLDRFEDFHFPAPIPLVRQNAVERANGELFGPLGRAYEIHNYANNIRSEPVISTLENIMRKSRNIYTTGSDVNEMIRLRIGRNFISGIHGNARYTPEEKERKKEQFYQIFDTRIATYNFTQDPVETQMIGLSVDYILDFNRSDLLRQLYIDTFLTDCIQAYSNPQNTDPYAGMSCTHGVIERLYTSVPDAIRQRLKEPDVGKYHLSRKQKQEYTRVLESYESYARIVREINVAVMDWFNTLDEESVPASFTQRKRLLTQHIVNHMHEIGFPDFHEDSPEIASYYSANTWLAISLSRNPPVMGGKKTRSNSRSNSRKETRRKSRGKKNKSTRRERKTRKEGIKKIQKKTQKIHIRKEK